MSAGKILSRLSPVAAILACAVVFGGCMSNKITDGRAKFYSSEYDAAAASFAQIKDKNGKDQVLALLEYGMTMHVAGKYKESIDALLEAKKLIEQNDVVSVTEQTGSMVSNEMIVTFKPESFERVLVHTYLAINFMLMDDWSAARVEARQTLKELDGLDEELRDQTFARYVCALAFEAMGDYDDAYIEYKQASKESPDTLQLYYDLYRLSVLRGLREERDKWGEKIKAAGGEVEPKPASPNLIVFVGTGRAPIKAEVNIVVPPNLNRVTIPEYHSSNSLSRDASLDDENRPLFKSTVLTDLDPLALKSLKNRIGKIIAKEVARVAAKEVIASQIENQSAILGLATRVAFFASEAADIRSWETLPRYLGVMTETLPAGDRDLTIHFFANNGSRIGPSISKKVTIVEGRRTVLSVRCVQ